MAQEPPLNHVDPASAVTSLLAHAHALAPKLCPCLYPAGFPADVTSLLQSKGLDSVAIATQLQAAGKSVGACTPDTLRVVSVFSVDVSRRIFTFSGLQAVPAELASFVHSDICTNEVSCFCRFLRLFDCLFRLPCGGLSCSS
jgi:hypothetical protein